jgi:hypothetical protein
MERMQGFGCALGAVMTFASTSVAAPAVTVEDPRQWLSAQGVTDAPLAPWGVDGCIERVVGTSRERALLCDEVVSATGANPDNPVYRVVTHGVVLVVRARKIVVLLDVETAIQVLDGPAPSMGRDGGWKNDAILALDLTIAADGMSATVGDTTDPKWHLRQSCKDTRVYTPTQDDRDRGRAEWMAFDNEWIRRLCNGRGTYVWRDDRFVPRKTGPRH